MNSVRCPRPSSLARLRIGLALAVACLLAACRIDLYSGLDETESNRMVAALASGHIEAEKVNAGESGWQLRIEERDMPAALEILRQQGLPAERHTSLGAVFQKQGLVATPAEERVRYIFGLSEELSKTLEQIDGVVSARVHVVIPANDPLTEKVKPSSAAVFIKHQPGTDLQLLVPAVKELVAHSVEGLTYDQVALTLVEARGPLVSSAPAPRGDAGGLFGLSPTALVVFTAVLTLGVLSLAALPWLLRRSGLPLRVWLRRAGFVR